MSHFHRRKFLQGGVVALANFVVGEPLPIEAQTETRRGIFDAHLHIPSDNGENFQWNLVTRNMAEFVAYLDKCGVRRGVISSSWSNKAQSPDDYRNGNRKSNRRLLQRCLARNPRRHAIIPGRQPCR